MTAIEMKDRVQTWLQSLPSTNFKTVAVVGLAYLTLAWLIAADLLGKPIDTTVLTLWLTFLGGSWGIAYASFAKQRTTDYGYMDRAKTPPPLAPVTTTTETAGPSVTTTTPAPEVKP